MMVRFCYSWMWVWWVAKTFCWSRYTMLDFLLCCRWPFICSWQGLALAFIRRIRRFLSGSQLLGLMSCVPAMNSSCKQDRIFKILNGSRSNFRWLWSGARRELQLLQLCAARASPFADLAWIPLVVHFWAWWGTYQQGTPAAIKTRSSMMYTSKIRHCSRSQFRWIWSGARRGPQPLQLCDARVPAVAGVGLNPFGYDNIWENSYMLFLLVLLPRLMVLPRPLVSDA